ncbi:MAG: hypothetical protein M1814_006477 [Vezdaea aestivalis]|nr:MAG: hypothetical protein M1814_006477 [Vezdaea aestivalis]
MDHLITASAMQSDSSSSSAVVNPPLQASEATSSGTSGKRKRSPSDPQSNPRPHPPSAPPPLSAPPSASSAPVAPAPASKAASSLNYPIHVNYLARSEDTPLPMVQDNDTLTNLSNLLGRYELVLQRSEGMAASLGATPLSQILLDRVNRSFDAPPRIISTGPRSSSASIDWIDVFQFATAHPDVFQSAEGLTLRTGARVRRFYIKGSEVELNEQDFSVIESGHLPILPRQPLPKDEEKELVTLDILEECLLRLIRATDAVSGKARTLKFRLANRRNAIAARQTKVEREAAAALSNGSATSPTGFTAVNTNSSEDPAMPDTNGVSGSPAPTSTAAATRARDESRARIRTELLRIFESNSHPPAPPRPAPSSSSSKHTSRPSLDRSNPSSTRRPVRSTSPTTSHHHHHLPPSPLLASAPTSTKKTPSPPSTANGGNKRGDDAGPYRAEMARRIDLLEKNDRIYPPCDRCRRLGIDCGKNLTACAGCTKKHARCSWKDVVESEMLEGLDGEDGEGKDDDDEERDGADGDGDADADADAENEGDGEVKGETETEGEGDMVVEA